MIDWTKPIEAVHADGRVAPVTFNGPDSRGYWLTNEVPADDGSENEYWYADGSSVCGGPWAIRNTQPTSIIPTALYERMVGLMRDMAGDMDSDADYYTRYGIRRYNQAREIAKELPAEVDPDRQIVIDHYLDAGVIVTDAALDLAVQILKRGRQLERGE